MMKTTVDDRLIIADAKKLLSYADPADLESRDLKKIKDLYHPDWFFDYNGSEYIEPPAVYIERGDKIDKRSSSNLTIGSTS